jgi:hypothetical protein
MSDGLSLEALARVPTGALAARRYKDRERSVAM